LPERSVPADHDSGRRFSVDRSCFDAVGSIGEQGRAISALPKLLREFFRDSPSSASTRGHVGKDEDLSHPNAVARPYLQSRDRWSRLCLLPSPMVDFREPWDIYILFAARLPALFLLLRVLHEHRTYERSQRCVDQ
jgi:hypothetical protein